MWNDRRLVRRAARGDSDAFATIFRRYQQDLYRYCVAILGDPQDAQDALQNTMVKALRALPGERRQIELKPWLYRIAHNESIDMRRHARPMAPLEEDVPAPVASLEETAADRRRLQDLLADIGELPERHRGALVMRELGGLDFDEIAAALDTSPGAARQVLYEARRSLQQMSDGREMKCDAVTAILSDGDGRVSRRRDVRAHLRDCAECRSFADSIRGRSETLAGIAPLGAIAAAAIAKGALAGTASGGVAGTTAGAATAGGGAAAGGGGGAAAAGLGGAAKLASTGAILKSTAAIVAVVGVSAVAVDHGHLFGGGGQHGAPHGPAAVAHGSSREGADADRRPKSFYMHPHGVEEVGIMAPPADPTRSVADHVASNDSGSGAKGTTAESVGADGATHPRHPAHPQHPAHPAHPQHPAHPERSTSRAHPTHPAHTDQTAHPTHPNHPAHPSHPEKSAQPSSSATVQPKRPPASEPANEAASAAPASSEHPESSHPAPAEAAPPVEVVAPTEGASAAAEPSEVNPGQARKEDAD